MIKMIAVRVSQAVPVLFLVSILGFTLLRLAPGDPAVMQLGLEANKADLASLRTELKLDEPIWSQYLAWLRLVSVGDFGTSYSQHASVRAVIGSHLPVTLQIAGLALLLTAIIGLGGGILAALKAHGIADRAVLMGSLAGISVPSFVVGIFLVLIFGWWVPGVLPYSGFVSPFEDPLSSLAHSILPAFAMAAPPAALVARMVRASMLEVLSQDYIRTSRSFGVPEREIVFRDALRNAILPVVTLFGLIAGYLVGGSVVIETIFSVPGIGRLLITSFGLRDYPVVVALLLLSATAFLFFNILVDIMYGVLNPRIRSGYKS